MRTYAAALALLSRRELSTAQLRERLRRREHADADINQAIARLTEERLLDDNRVALACARTEAALKGRGRRRVLQQVQRLGIDAATAEAAVAEVFGEIDGVALLDRAIDRRLRGATIASLDAQHRNRLIRAVVTQGFSLSDVLGRLRERRTQAHEDEADA